MSVLLIAIKNEENLKTLHNFIQKNKSSSRKVDSICINITDNNVDLYDSCLHYIVKNDLPGEIVNEEDLVKYVKESTLEIYDKKTLILVDPYKETEQIIEINSREKDDFFYLAEKYKQENNNKQAEEYYNLVINDANYNDQHKYIACLNLGKLASTIIDKIKYFLMGISFDHERAECYFELVVLENSRGNNKKAAFYGLQCPIENLDKPRNVDHSKLQINSSIHKCLLDLNIGVACFYVNLKQEGYLATLRALKGAEDDYQRNAALSNLKYYSDMNKQMTFRPELLIIDDFYHDCNNLTNLLFKTDNQTKEYMNIELMINDHSHFIIKPKWDFSIVRNMFRKIFHTELGELCESSGLINLKGGYMSNWVNYNHNHTWNIVIFLQPNSQDSSLELLKHNPTKSKEVDKNNTSVIEKDVYDSSAWSVTEKIEEKYNRCILYKGNRYFQFTKYYNGATLDTYMMYQSFCFDL